MKALLESHGIETATNNFYSERFYILEYDLAIGYYNVITGKFELLD